MINNVLAHILYYRKYKGDIPEGCEIDHLCRNTSCVNPDHLEAVSHAINIQRSSLAKLNAEQVMEVRKRSVGGERNSALARSFNISPSAIWMIVNGRSWKNLLGVLEEIV